MIQIAGTDYEQPTDKAIVAYDGGKYVLISSGDVIQRVKMDEFAEPGVPAHDHDNDNLRPHGVYLKDGGTQIQLTCDGSSYFKVMPLTAGSRILAVAENHEYYAVNNLKLGTDGGTATVVRIWGQDGYKKALADAWLLNPSFLSNKTNVQQIADPHTALAPVRGLTFTQNGIDQTGVAVEDLQSSPLPGLVNYDKDNEVEGIDPLSLVAPLIEAVRDLDNRVKDLEGP